MGSIRAAVFGLLLLAACASPAPILPGEGDMGPPCDQVIPGCEARRLENVVLRGDETDGVLFSVDGLDISGLVGFDEALAGNGYLGGGETVQVILGAADADRLRWGSGTTLYYAIRFEGSCPAKVRGPAGYDPPPEAFACDVTTTSVVDAHTAEVVVTSQVDPP
jgi:hypothetical protein